MQFELIEVLGALLALRGLVSTNFQFGGMVFWSDIFMIRSGYLGYKMIFEALFLTMNVSFS